jgi:uncharacterized membrane protein (DUF4010 family)
MPQLSFPILDFAIALLIGALVGIDRERKKAGDETSDTRGLRSFILLAETGAVSAWLALRLDAIWLFALATVVVAAIVMAGYLAYALTQRESYGLTTEIAAVVVFLLGGLVIFGFRDLAVMLAIVTSAVLAFKAPLHGLVARLSQEDIYAGLKLLIATFIVLPILPDEPLDPWGAINPQKMWWLVILISALSLAGYVASRWLGSQHGVLLTGLFGGLASSTAVTLTLARRSNEQQTSAGLAHVMAAGLLISWTVMFGRILVAVAFVNPSLLRPLAAPIAAMGLLVAVVAGGYYVLGRRSTAATSEEVPLTNPFSLTSAAKFALVFTAVLLAVKLVENYWPGQGFYAVAALAGLTDVDAITLSMAEYAKQGTPAESSPAAPAGAAPAQIAAASIGIAAISNTLTKCGLVAALGSRGLAWRIAAATAIVVTGGAITIWIAFFLAG